MKTLVYVFLGIAIIGALIFGLVLYNKENPIDINGDGNMIIEYTEEPQALMNSMRYIRIYDNKKVEFGRQESDVVRTKTISDEKYNEIINIAFSKKFLSLEGKDISDSRVLDGYFTYITVYTENSKGVRIGGSNPSQKTFNKLVRLIEDLKE